MYYVVRKARVFNETIYLKLKGLEENARYSVGGEIKSGRTLMNYGILLDTPERDGDNMILEIKKI